MFFILCAICCLQWCSKLAKVIPWSAWMLAYVGFSSINCEGGLGTAALTSIYAGFVVGSLFLPTITIQRFGLKWTMEMDWDLSRHFRTLDLTGKYDWYQILFVKQFLSLGTCYLHLQIFGLNFIHWYQLDSFLVSVVQRYGLLMLSIQHCLHVNLV